VPRFVDVLHNYRISGVVGDAYAGETWVSAFNARGIS
jgi:hypothetical protein